jgi:hypothetical protein
MSGGSAVLYRDSRFGEKDRWVYGDPSDARMRLNDDITQCLGFLVTKTTDEIPEGTAFFLSVPSEAFPSAKYYYLVTARHVITDDRGKLIPKMFLRVNTKAGGRKDIRLDEEWICHRNKDIDVAVMPISAPSSEFEWAYNFYAPPGSEDSEGQRDNSLADQQVVDEWGIGIGDELRVVGLFSKRVGNKRNLPVVRSGIIAAMPEEPIEAQVMRGGKLVKITFDAYLAELRSIGGLSGSPVFVAVEKLRKGRNILDGFVYKFFLLGMIRGHWHYEKQSSFITSAAVRPKDIEQVNMGMALVTPIADVLEVLYDEKGKAMKLRKQGDKELARRKAGEIKEDSARPKKSKEKQLTREGFQGVLKQVSRKVSVPESKDSETSE